MSLARVLPLVGFLAASPAAAAVLYDGALATTPDAQSWLYGCYPLPCQALQTARSGVTTLETFGASDILAGYFASFSSTLPPINFRHPLLPTLDRARGYTIRFDLRVASESHGARVDRAGLSVIVISEDLKGIELGFWADEIWAQADEPVFTHAEARRSTRPPAWCATSCASPETATP